MLGGVTVPGNASLIARAAVIPAGPGATATAIALAQDFALAARCEPARAGRLTVIVEELVTNLLDHAGLADGVLIALTLTAEGSNIRLELIDPGPAFDPRQVPPPAAPPPRRGGGAGLALVRAWTEIEAYESRAEGNCLRLRLLPMAIE